MNSAESPPTAMAIRLERKRGDEGAKEKSRETNGRVQTRARREKKRTRREEEDDDLGRRSAEEKKINKR